MVVYREKIAAFEEACHAGALWDEHGFLTLPPALHDWTAYVDGRKSSRIPSDGRNHVLALRGPDDLGLLTVEAIVKPSLRVVR